MIEIKVIEPGYKVWNDTIKFAKGCSWRAGIYLAKKMEDNDFEENETCSIEIKSCEEDALAELVKIKKAFKMTASMSKLQEIKDNLPYEISDDFSYMKALKILKDLKLNKVKIDLFHID